MKHKLTGVLIGLAAFALTVANAQAGEINANEQSLISAVSQSFSYNGATYVVKSSYIAQGRSKLAQDDVDLSASDAQGYVSQFHGSYQELVSEGYCDVVSEGTQTGTEETTPEPEHSKKESQENKLLLKTIFGKPDKKKNSQKSETTTIDGEMTTATQAPQATEVPNADDAWDKEEDLGTSITFEDVDRTQAKEQKVTISGIGSEYTLDFQEDAGKDSTAAKAEMSDNFMDRILQLYALKVMFFVVLGLSVISAGLAIYYIAAVKGRHRKKRGLRRGIAISIGICSGGWAFLVMAVASLYFGVYNTNSIQRQLMESDYFLGVTQMIRETAQSQLQEEGYDQAVASEVFTLSSVYIEEKQYIAKVLAGQKDAEISTDAVESALKTELASGNDKKDAAMIEELTQTYQEMLQFDLGSVIYQSRNRFMSWTAVIAAVGIVLFFVFFVLACRLYGYPHKAARVTFVSLLVASCLIVGGAFAAKMLHIADQIQATPVYYLQFLQKYASWTFNVFLYVGCLGVLASIALLIWKRYLHTVYAE